MSLFKSKEERLYYEIACRADEIILESIVGEMPSRKELQKMYTFSEEFERKMRALIESIGQRRIIPMRVKRIIVIAAVIAALILGALGASAILKSVYNLYISHREDHSVATYSETSDTDYAEESYITSYYEPDYIPTGFSEEQRIKTETLHCIYYVNEDKLIIFTQNVASTQMQIDTENTNLVYINTEDIDACYVKKGDNISLMFERNGYAFQVEGNVSIQTALEIALSVKLL